MKELKLALIAGIFFFCVIYSFFYLMSWAGLGNAGGATDDQITQYIILAIPPVLGFLYGFYLLFTLNKKPNK